MYLYKWHSPHDTFYGPISILNSVSLGNFFSALSCHMHARIVNLFEVFLMQQF